MASEDERTSTSGQATEEGGSNTADQNTTESQPSAPSEVHPVQDAPTHTTNPASDDVDETTRDRIASGSPERVKSLTQARHAALNSSPSAARGHNQAQAPYIPPRPTSLPMYEPPFRRSTNLLNNLRKLTYIFSFLLGSTAVVSLFWSTFILPLLASSFSARQVLVEQQKERLESLLSGLRALRSSSLYPPSPFTTDIPSSKEISQSNHQSGISNREEELNQELMQLEHKSGIEEIPSSRSSTSSHHSRQPSGTPKASSTSPLPISSLSSLSPQLRELSSAISSTSTTRTSLLSTLESYTSQLHREVHLRATPYSQDMGVGLGTLGANLSKEGGGSVKSSEKGPGWDEVRKEIRGIKGLLLGRRNFAPAQSPTAGSTGP